MRRLSVAIRRIAQRLSAQEGSLLIEVMVGAVLVVGVSAAVLDGLKGAQDTGVSNRARTASASLAQQDQERLRSKPVTQLSNYRETRNLTVGSVNYTIKSRTDWVNDASGVVSCTNGTNEAQYMRLSSTVNSNRNSQSPVEQTSVVSPPRGAFTDTDGTIAIRVVDRNDAPLEGVRVDLSGPRNLSDVTNDLGCVVFGFIPEGDYEAATTSLGLVGIDGASPYQVDLQLTGGTTLVHQVALDRPATVVTSFETLLPGASTPVALTGSNKRMANSRLPSPGSRTFTVGTPSLAITATNVFPFVDGYGVFAGTCHEANNPVTYDEDYYTKAPGDRAFVSPGPGGSATAVARVPAINVEVQNSSGTIQTGMRVFVTAADPPDCDDAYPMQLSTATGALPQPAFPFGEYTLCADNNALLTSARRRTPTTQATATNYSPAGTAKQILRMSTSGSLCAPRT